jgi:peroxiredoxin Q/BCP
MTPIATPTAHAIAIGLAAPDFVLPDSDGRAWRLSERLPYGPVVLFFYPTAMTIGCTAQSCRFRDLGAEFAAAGAQRVGVSASDQALQGEFGQANGLDFPLLSDVDGGVAALYGARRAFSARPVKRATYVIGRDGVIAGIVTSELRLRAHADRSLEVVRGL